LDLWAKFFDLLLQELPNDYLLGLG
jgi:hypothetical protein